MRVRSGSRAEIDEFLRQRRLAVVGVSRNEKEYGRAVFRELRKGGREVTPINPSASEIDGVACYASISEVGSTVDGALVLLPAASAAAAVRECVEAGIRRIWIRTDVPEARELCEKSGVTLISGFCPLMFLPNADAAFVHACHAFGLKLAGIYPK